MSRRCFWRAMAPPEVLAVLTAKGYKQPTSRTTTSSPLEEPVVVGYAESRHACVTLGEGRIIRLPQPLHDCISQHIKAQAPSEAG